MNAEESLAAILGDYLPWVVENLKNTHIEHRRVFTEAEVSKIVNAAFIGKHESFEGDRKRNSVLRVLLANGVSSEVIMTSVEAITHYVFLHYGLEAQKTSQSKPGLKTLQSASKLCGELRQLLSSKDAKHFDQFLAPIGLHSPDSPNDRELRESLVKDLKMYEERANWTLESSIGLPKELSGRHHFIRFAGNLFNYLTSSRRANCICMLINSKNTQKITEFEKIELNTVEKYLERHCTATYPGA